ncbi:hypothetical protein Swit_0272 [Rhizorhabdus wittichii RW1]|uniref:Porin family protein n=1 Tax=Rhizorhabdus wittichii (strain DSM 6014 / CCUG 31198 / JCM 15750 / NBRC 105917 / EY 4224 / RW1) TaxID=392499 RepID=A0A9J9H822_RHIWR|nr:hypothetical protein Swit_0272 [Rhizorhabdus wittichii RW1]
MRAASWGAWLLLAAPGPAFAAGGGHVVDDAAVEAPGACHVESWVTRSSHGAGLINVAPACTREAWPDLEIGGFVSHGWTRAAADTVIGIAPKLMLRSEDHGLGVGVATSVGYDIGHGRIETASMIVPVTIPVGARLRFNLDGGWQWSRADHGHDLFVGGQVEFALRPTVGLMTELFTRDQGKPGGQAGVRWTVDAGRIDLDVLAGRYLDGATPTAITIGVTVRR